MIMCASASTVAAPPMSFFMISMALSGLRSSPPVSKHTPLPTSVTLGSPALPQRSSISRGARAGSAARPTAWMSGKFCFSRSSPTMERNFAPCCLASARAAASSSAGPHVVGRRVDQIAGQRHALGDARQIVAIDAVGQHQPHRLVLGLAVAREAVGAEREGQRGEPRIVRRIGEAVGAGRQHAGQQARQEGVVVVLVAFQTEQHAAGRQDQVPAGPGLEARGLHIGAVALAELGDDLGEG